MGILQALFVSFAFEGGIANGSTLTLYSTDLAGIVQNHSKAWYSDFSANIELFKYLHIDNNVTSFQWKGRANNFCPFRVDYTTKIYTEYHGLSAGYSYGCFHPIAPSEFYPLPKMDAAVSRIYLKYETDKLKIFR